MPTWERVIGFVGQIPAGVWVGLSVANVVVTVATWSVARRLVRRAGERPE
ncbi:MAG TPA: hypothetical protein VFC00_28880 [Micromonosporaceae bacterium]|nr:hypothetical protein [Micromonosporaceae bacterium]